MNLRIWFENAELLAPERDSGIKGMWQPQFPNEVSIRGRWHQFLIFSVGFFFGYLVNGVCEHPYVYAVLILILEAMATFVGQVLVLSLIALFGAATTTMVTGKPQKDDTAEVLKSRLEAFHKQTKHW